MSAVWFTVNKFAWRQFQFVDFRLLVREGAASDEKVIAFYAHFHRHSATEEQRGKEQWRGICSTAALSRAVTFPWCAHKIPGPINNKTKSIKQFSNWPLPLFWREKSDDWQREGLYVCDGLSPLLFSFARSLSFMVQYMSLYTIPVNQKTHISGTDAIGFVVFDQMVTNLLHFPHSEGALCSILSETQIEYKS